MFPLRLKSTSLRIWLPQVASLALMTGLFFSCQPSLPDDGHQSFAAITLRSKASFHENGYLVIGVPGRRDYLAMKPDFTGTDDVVVGIDLADFMQAGLDPAHLDAASFHPGTPVYDLPTSTLLISFDLGNPIFDFSGYRDTEGKKAATPEASSLMAEIIRTLPANLSTDTNSRRHALALGSQASLEWGMLPLPSQVEPTNPDELALTLDPAPFIAAGLDANKLQTWKPASRQQSNGTGGFISSPRLVLSIPLP